MLKTCMKWIKTDPEEGGKSKYTTIKKAVSLTSTHSLPTPKSPAFQFSRAVKGMHGESAAL